MYCPSAFRQNDLAALHAHIQSTGLALLTSAGASGLQASHLPLILAPEEGEFGTLYGHIARANPHWRDLAAGAEALVVFSGPDAYVHPGWYAAKTEHGKVVPTWNYITVQAWGAVEVFEDPQRLRQVVGALTDRHEGGFAAPWQVDDAPVEYIDSMLRAIVGFALPIQRIEGKWKLGQNRSQADQVGVYEGLCQSPREADRQLAASMAQANHALCPHSPE